MRLTRPLILLALGGGLAACDDVAIQSLAGGDAFPSRADLAAYDTAVASIGCDLVSESDYLPIEFQTGFTREQVLQITSRRLSRDDAVRLPGGGVRLVTGPCAPGVAPETVPRAETVATAA